MNPPRTRRTPALLAGTALTVSALVVAGAAPASAAPVHGNIAATAEANTNGTCALAPDEASSSGEAATFTSGAGGATAHVQEGYHASAASTVGASGSIDVETTASGSTRDRAFKRLDLESTGLVMLRNDAALDCGLELLAASEATAVLKVAKRGKVRIAWNSSAGDLERFTLKGAAGVVLDRVPTRPEGEVTVRVKPGRYTLTSKASITADEADVAVGATATTLGFYTLRATYLS
ncbi:hypothetical protein [Nocardioides sp. MH1]|uniref:hypothetical protein n=1 Tax=Nocardioides sp. MH1 TaxID=3242490 RepID=UPI00352283B7